MYAIIEAGGRQCRVEPGAQIVINTIGGKVGAQHKIDRVLLASDGKSVKIGKPYVTGALVLCEVLEHSRGPKVLNYKFRRRENFRKTKGFRQNLTKLLVKDVTIG